MPELSLVINSAGAVAGASQFEAAVARVEAAAARADRANRQLVTVTDGVGSASGRAANDANAFADATTKEAVAANNAAKSVDKLGKETRDTGNESSRAAKSTREFAGAAELAKAAIVGLATGIVVKKFVEFSDAAVVIANRLRLVTSSTKELETVQAAVFDQAQASRVAFSAQAELYQRVARAASILGKSTADALSATDAIAKAITISGVTAVEAENAIRQLGQGLSLGVLRGQDLRSVLEQAPRLAQAIAQGLGVSVGKIRQLGEEGKLTSEAVFSALQKELPQLKKEFESLTPTFSQAGAVLENSLIKATGTLNEAVGISGAFSQALLNTAAVIDGSLLPGLIDTSVALKGLAVSFIAAIDQALIKSDLLVNSLEQNVADLRKQNGVVDDAVAGAASLADKFNELPSVVQTVIRNLPGFGIAIGAAADAAKTLNERTKAGNDLASKRKTLQEDLNASESGAQKTINDLVQKRIDLQKKLDDARKGDTSGVAGGGKDPNAGGVAEIPKAVATEIQKLVDSTATPLEKFQQQLERLKELRDIAPKAVTLEVFNRALQQSVDEFAQADPTIKAYNDQIADAQKLTEQVASPQEKYNKALEQYNALLHENLITQDTFNRLQVQAADALAKSDGSAKAHNELLKEGLQLTEALRTPQEEYVARVDKANQLLNAGAISQDTYNRELDAAKEASGIAVASLDSFAKAAGAALSNNVTDLFLNPTKEGFKDFATSAIDSLQRVAAEALKNLAVNAIIGAIGGAATGGTGGLVSAFVGALGGTSAPEARATGGPVTSGQPYVVGEREREMFVPQQNGTILNGEQMAALSPTIHNTVVVDTKGFTEALNTPRGSKDLINAISVNRSAIKGALQ